MEYFFPIKLYAPQSKDELKGLIYDEDIYLGDIDTSAITDMSELFYESGRKDFSGIESWDVSSVTDMSWMFTFCYNFNQPLDNWDVSSVIYMSEMFAGCTNFNQSLDNWDVGSVTDMSGMFRDCENFNQPLDSWDVSSVTDMSGMFINCYNFNQPLNNWDVSNVTDMSGMFSSCENFNQPLNSWDVGSVTDMGEMFTLCENFNQPLNSWDVGSVTDMGGMFRDCDNFNQPLDSWRDKLSQKLIDQLPLICFVERKIVNNKTRYYPKTKDELRSLVRVESLNLGDIDTSTITDMSGLFYRSWREDFNGIDSWDVSSVTDMSMMFFGCDNFNQPLNNWDVSSVIYMSGMFRDCKNFNQPLNNWNVSSVIYMREMFGGCTNFNQPLDSWRDKLSQKLIDQLPLICFVERKIVNNKTRYYPKTRDELESLVRVESLNLGDIDTSAITDMSWLFCRSGRKDFSGIESWDVSNVTNMNSMFNGCKNFNQPLNNWNVSSVTDMRGMFYGCEINDENKHKFTNMYDLMEKDDDEIPF
ncbi:BspA family leucine-rich repeat surface protein [Campylobacter lanienae]|uniref:BspA family leucine-rich repeat surface protein n=1 Tax=Campylobacter lanienae TaxID=75658 RepID=UPI000BB3EBFE|nr:BspA family leucine-rich repeat surface protein [Campylobacter lanienae]